jgi:formylglycine-generating enzyme required for sulfatase activity
MSPFEAELARARSRQRRFIFGSVVLGLLLITALTLGIYSGKGTKLEILPTDAKATAVVNIIEGAAFSVDQVVYSLGGAALISVSAEGFQATEHRIEEKDQGKSVEIKLNEIPATLRLTTEPNRSETRWSINGKEPEVSSEFTVRLPSGSHTIDVNNSYFHKEIVAFDLKRAEIRDATVQLKPLSGKVKITTSPSGAEISVAGKPVGLSPIDLSLEGGRHNISARKNDYKQISEDIIIWNEQTKLVRNYILIPAQATLAFSIAQKGGVLLLNGREIKPLESIEVPANKAHTVSYAISEYVTESQIVTLKAGEIRRLSFRLKPDLGVVDIRVKPGGKIFVDGNKVGDDAVKIKRTSRPHRLLIKRAGYRSVERKFTPSSKHKTILNIELEIELQARLRETLETYTNSAGVRLTRFKPSSIIMGAPRHEKGQRANEIVRNVHLKKIFYASLHEVTEAQFGKFRGGGGSDHPVVNVSWIDAALFCNWLSRKEKLEPFYNIKSGKLIASNPTADGYRLLTEAEWEWLARRAGKDKQTHFTWGDKSVVPKGAGNIADEHANGIARYYVPNYNDGYERLAPVGKYPAEPSGLFDLTGNAREWVHDAYSIAMPVGNIAAVDPVGSALGDSHTVKGSSWKSGTRTTLRAAYREGVSGTGDDIGFRIGRYLYAKDGNQKK